MNPSPANALDRDALVELLSQLDSSHSDAVATDQPPSTVRELKAELDTLIGEIRKPAGPDPFADETGLRRAQDLVLEIGLEPASTARDQRLDLGRIGPYELLEKLGEGGMGAVYKALHSSLEKIVALKVLPRDRLNPQSISRFKREMKAVGKLDHPNIVRATDAGEAGGDHFLVMEFVDGVDLAELLRRVGPLPAAEACELVRQAAVGLQHAHQRGMVHRDIKPNNIMLTWGEEHAPAVKILDMGLALLNEQKNPAHGDLTTTGQMMGTLEYMSPEQGLDTHNVDIRADIYSLGATLYKLLCGKAPFSGERYNTPGKLLVALATETPASIGTKRDDLPAGLVAIVDRMLAREPTDRPATPAEVAQALAPFASGANLPRLANSARHPGASTDQTTDQSVTPTDQFLSSPSTGTKPGVSDVVRESRAVRESPDPAPAEVVGWDESASPTTPPVVAAKKVGLEYSSHPTKPNLKSALRNPKWLAAIAAGLLALAAGAFGIIKILTPDGDYVIQTDDPDLSFSVSKDVVTLHDKKTKREYTMKAVRQDNGIFELDVTVVGADLSFKVKEFTIKRGQQVALKAHFERKTADAVNAPPSTDPDRRAAEYALSVGGTIRIEVDGQPLDLTAVDVLPRGRFELTTVSFHSNAMVRDAGLAVFKDCKHLTYLSLNQTDVGDTGLAHFKDCKNLVELDLNETQVSDAGLAHFKDRKNFTILTLGYTKVSDTGLANFQDCKNLTILDLGNTKVSDTGLAHFRDCKNLTNLQLPGTEVSDAGLAHFKDCNFITLNLGDTRVSDAGLSHFRDCKNLTQLVLNRTQVSDAGLAHFKDCKNLTQLELGSTMVSDAGLAHFQVCKNLTWLTLGGTQVSDAGLAYFKDCKDLAHLELWNTEVSDAGLVHFKECKNLTALFLDSPQVSDAGLVHLKDCKNLTVLRLNSTRVSDVGLERLTDFPNLKQLYIPKTKVTEVGVKKLSAALPGCKIEWDGGVIEPSPSTDRRAAEWLLAIAAPFQIEVNGQQQSPQSVAELPKAAFTLHVVNLIDNPKADDVGLAHLKDCQRLFALALSGPQFTEAGLANFRDRHSLRHLTLGGAGLTDAGLANFQGHTLVHLGLAGVGITQAGLANFKDSVDLTHLSLEGPGITDAGLANFQGHALVNLALVSPGITPAGLAHFKDSVNLTHLHLEGSGITDACLDHFKDCPLLTAVALPKTQVSDSGLERLARFTKLTSVNLKHTKVTEAGVKKLAAALPGCRIEWDGGVIEPTVVTDPDRRAAEWALNAGESLSIAYDGEFHEPLTHVAELPADPFKVVSILFYPPAEVDDDALENLQDLTGLSDALRLVDQPITDAGVERLTTMPGLANLPNLDLARTRITNLGMAYLNRFKKLQSLNLGGTKVTDDGLKHIGDMPLLQQLYINDTAVTDTGVAHLRSLKLTTLFMHNCQGITGAGLDQLRDMTDLVFLHIQNTPIGADDVKKLATALPQCKIAWNGGVIEPSVATDPDRRAAESVLSVGGRVVIEVDGKGLESPTIQQWRAEPFRVSSIGLYPPAKVDDTALENLRGLTSLGWLALVDQPITDAGVERLTTMPGLAKLESLDLSFTEITDVGVGHLKQFRKLGNLHLTGTNITDGGLSHIGEMNLGGYLVVDKTAITDAGLAHLRGVKLGALHLSNCPGIKGPGLEHLRDMTSLIELNLAGNSIGDDGLVHLRNLVELERLDIQGTRVTEASLPVIAGFKKLKTLALDGLPITDAGLKELVDLPQLESLGLRYTKVTDDGLNHLRGMTRLKELHLHGTAVTDAGLEFLQDLKQLAVIYLSGSNVTADGVKKLSAALPGCKIEWDGVN